MIGDLVWWDENKDGLQDSGEAGIKGVTVNLYKFHGSVTTHRNGVVTVGGHGLDGKHLSASQITGDDGSYRFENLEPTQSSEWTDEDGATHHSYWFYTVEFVPPTGFQPTINRAGDSVDVDSDASGANVHLAQGEARLDIDAGFVAGEFTFFVPENSPIGTVVGSVALAGATGYLITPGNPFAITSDGTIVVADPTHLDYELRETWQKPVTRFLPSPPNSVVEIVIIVTDVNEKPEYDQSVNLVVAPYHWVGLPFKDPEGDAIVSVSGNPAHGVLVMNNGIGDPSNDAYWVPYVAPTDDTFTLTASDGTNTSEPVEIAIDVNGVADFGRFRLGTNPTNLPPTQVDLDPGASGDVNWIHDPDYKWHSIAPVANPLNPTNDDYVIYASAVTGNILIGDEWHSVEAQAAMQIYLSNPTPDTEIELDVLKILQRSQNVRYAWDEAIAALIATIDAKEFVGPSGFIVGRGREHHSRNRSLF